MRVVFGILFILLTVSGCSSVSEGPKYSEAISEIPPLEAGKARLFVFRNWAYYSGGLDARIRVEGFDERKLATDTFTYIDVSPGPHRIAVDTQFGFGRFLMAATLKKDREYYFAVDSGVSMFSLVWSGIITAGAVEETDPAVREIDGKVLENSSELFLHPVKKEDALGKISSMNLAL